MRLRLPPDQMLALHTALQKAGLKEIGGQIFGEQLAPSDFRVKELTFQKRPGTFARFIVDLAQAARDSLRFFEKTGHQYTKFNYIGEWHSHPSFEVKPSNIDISAMHSIVNAASFQGTFAVLMIARLDSVQPTCGAWLFDTIGRVQSVLLEIE